jgi:hypothetical protein
MKTTRSILLLLSFALLSCAGTDSILEQAVLNANKEILAVRLVEHADGTASYEVRSKSGLKWLFPTIEYPPSATGVAEEKHREYYELLQITAPSSSVMVIQEHSRLTPSAVIYAEDRFTGRMFPLLAAKSTVYAVFVAKGTKGTLYTTSRAKGSFVSGKVANSSIITGLSAAGVLMGNVLFKWRDIEVKNLCELDARTKIAED